MPSLSRTTLSQHRGGEYAGPDPSGGAHTHTVNDVSAFISRYPLLRSNRYEVFLTLPGAMGGDHWGPLWAENITLPGRSITVEETRSVGPIREMPKERVYSGDLDVTFVLLAKQEWTGNDNVVSGGGLRWIMEIWMDQIISPTQNVLYYDRLGSNSYTGSMEIMLLREGGSSSGDNSGEYEVDYHLIANEVFPKTISPVPLSYATPDEYIRQTVSFSFRDYKIE